METKKTKKQKLIALALLCVVPAIIISVLIYQLMPGKEDVQKNEENKFNKSLPSPKIEDEPRSKLEAYLRAQDDSIKKAKDNLQEQIPRFFNPGPPDQVYADQYDPGERPMPTSARMKNQEKKMNEQLARLDKVLQPMPETFDQFENENLKEKPSVDVTQLEQLMATLQQNAEEDPELKRAERIVKMITELKSPPVPKPDSTTTEKQNISTIPHTQSNGFYGLRPSALTPSTQNKVIKATTLQDQILNEGSTITLMLEQDIYLDNQRIPAGTLLDGQCSFANERIQVNIDKLVYNNVFFPLRLKVYDLRGNEGIYVPGLVTPEGAKATANEALQSLNIASLDQSMSTQAINTAIQGIKSAIARKTTKLNATVKANSKVLLR
ncbi:conjugative transposon protein TraM [Pseudoflavitalea rhizosphaerae]|uniref:conjugative transposon protein TraM n=1 Tax=Pseudoflavitalea rhizosphaerae TaxID=1884793 RepID=UPI000F8E7637|nr:conjugative transposon protein TraM [Pseudoflavitalea rhizosphaerae]